MPLLKELVHNYDSLVEDNIRVMNRLKALYRGRAIDCAGAEVYHSGHREEWLGKLREGGAHRRAEFLYAELDHLKGLRQQAKRAMLEEARCQAAYPVLRQVPVLGPIRIAQILATVVSPHRFRTKRQLWAYCGLGVTTRSSADYQFLEGRVQVPVRSRGFPCAPRSRESIKPRRVPSALSGRGPCLTVCPLARPEIAIGPGVSNRTMVGNFESDHRFSWKGQENTRGRKNWKADDGVGEEGEGKSKNSGSF